MMPKPGRIITYTSGYTDRKSTRLNSSHSQISYAVFCLKKKKKIERTLGTAHRGQFVVFLLLRLYRRLRIAHLFFFNDTATTEIYTLSLHDALPISGYKARDPYSSWRSLPVQPETLDVFES